MQEIRVALLQITAGGDQEANLAKGDVFCRKAKVLGADVALFPEMWNIGYTPFVPPAPGVSDLWRAPERWTADLPAFPVDEAARRQWQAQAIGEASPFVAHFRALARELDLAIALTYLQAWPVAPRNVVSLIDRRGEILFTYAKVHTCDFDPMEDACTPGEDFYVATLDTAGGEVKVGAMICFDREFPESARILMLKGAEIILVPNACEMEANRLGQLRARAFENMVGVALANYAGPPDHGHSVAYSPVAFDREGRSLDTRIVEAGEREGVYVATFDLGTIRDCRQREIGGNAFRRPQCYAPLISPAVEPPFVRVNPRGERYDRVRR